MKRIFSFFFMLAVIATFSLDCTGTCGTVGSKINGKLYKLHTSREYNGQKYEIDTYFLYNTNYLFNSSKDANSKFEDDVNPAGTNTTPGAPNADKATIRGLFALTSSFKQTFTLSKVGVKTAVAATHPFEVSDSKTQLVINILTYNKPDGSGYDTKTYPYARLTVTLDGTKITLKTEFYDDKKKAYELGDKDKPTVEYTETSGL